MQEYTLKVSGQDALRRLDLVLTEYSKNEHLGLSRNVIQKMVLEGKVIVKNLATVKPHYKVKEGDEIRICVLPKEPSIIKPEGLPLDIIYEDSDLAVINKPVGMVVHPAPGNYEHTLVNALLFHFEELSDVNPGRPGIVHRLDKETSGCLAIAKNNVTHYALTKQFSKHSIKRIYIALVKGKMEFDENVIELPLKRHPLKRKNMSVGFGSDAKYSKTYYRTLKRSKDFSLLEIQPYTGRTHQIRVHLAFAGHPVLGDSRYGKNNDFIRLALHAKTIGFIHPATGKYVEFQAPVPKEFMIK